MLDKPYQYDLSSAVMIETIQLDSQQPAALPCRHRIAAFQRFRYLPANSKRISKAKTYTFINSIKLYYILLHSITLYRALRAPQPKSISLLRRAWSIQSRGGGALNFSAFITVLADGCHLPARPIQVALHSRHIGKRQHRSPEPGLI